MKECVIWCDCEHGVIGKTSLRDTSGHPIAFYLTEDECIFLQGICTHCGHEIAFKCSIMQLLMDCPKDRVTL